MKLTITITAKTPQDALCAFGDVARMFERYGLQKARIERLDSVTAVMVEGENCQK